jgi:hypothetical protein
MTAKTKMMMVMIRIIKVQCFSNLCTDLAASYKISIITQVKHNTKKQQPIINLKTY